MRWKKLLKLNSRNFMPGLLYSITVDKIGRSAVI